MRVIGYLFVVLLFLCQIAVAQPRFAGKVVEVVDGRTLVIDANAGRITVQIEYIETPAPDQQFHKAMRDHLALLALGKMVEFRPLRLESKVTVGRVEMGGVDLGLQLVRNGAAWHEPADTSGQIGNDVLDYVDNQAIAKAERRGVWSVPNLKTPWQIRAEKQVQIERVEKEAKAAKPASYAVNQYQTVNRRGVGVEVNNWDGTRRSELNAWGDVFAGVGKELRGLQTYTDPKGRFDAIYTSAAFLNMNGGKLDRRLECRLLFAYVNMSNGQRQTIYAIGFRSIADDYHFSKQKSRLTFTADKRNLAVGEPAYGKRGDGAVGTSELFSYQLTSAQVRSIANAKNLQIRIDGMLGTVSEDGRDLFNKLAATAN